MAILKPYPRIFIPQVSDIAIQASPYLSDIKYVDQKEATSLIDTARLIIEDYFTLCEYIEPIDDNKNTYSHRTYELLLRVATEFEANCKGILLANGYNIRKATIKDYHKLNTIMLLDQYEVKTSLWSPTKSFRPLIEWSRGFSLLWYQSYNESKHNRFSGFSKASLKNVFVGICSLVVVLAAQFPFMIGRLSGRSNLIFTIENEPNSLSVSDFTIKFPVRQTEQKYDFEWENIKNHVSPFEMYNF